MALTIFPFKRFQDVLDSHTHISDCENYKSEHFCFVTPTPEISDRVFRFYESHYDASNFEVITVSFFLKKLFQLFEINRPPVQKVDLMTHLCVVWKRYFPHEDFTKFFNTFELFTEWRSYSLDLALFDPLMTSLDDVTKKAIQIFWIYCRDADFLDEHGTYKELESFLSENSKSKNTITKSFCENTGYENFTIKRDLKFIFYGFTHLTALQIDFLKTLGGMFEVVLPVPIILFKKQILKHSDWPNWFSDVFDVHSLSEDIDTDKTTLKYSVMNLSEQQIMYQKLREELSIGKDLGKDSTKYIKIIFGSEWSYSDLAIYHLPHDQATLDENIFVMEYVEFENNLDTFWSEIKKNQDSSGTLNVSLIDLEKESLVWYTQSLLHQKWRLAKVYELFLEALSDLRDVVGEVDNFYLKLLKIRVQLNLPRNKSIIGKNYGLEKIDNESIFWCPNFSNVNKVLIHIGEGFLEMRRGSARYTSETFKVLSGIGPIQRGALRFEWLFVSMLQITHSHSQFHLVFESLEVKNSFEKFMNEIIPSVSLVEEKFYFHNINMNVVNFQTQFSQGLLTKKINFHHSALHVKKPLSNSLLTPTKIQKYIDCPRSYYATYMMPVKAEVKNPFRMEKFEVGNIEHQVIQEYFTNYHEVDDQKLLQICQESLRAFEFKSKKNLDDLEKITTIHEVFTYSKNALDLLLKLKKYPGFRYDFELKIVGDDLGVGGVIDFVFYSELISGVIDFKRSQVPTVREIADYKSVQVAYYVHLIFREKFSVENSTHLVFGYLNLSNISKSVFLELNGSFAESLFLDFGIKLHPCSAEWFTDFSKFHSQLFLQMTSDREYEAMPRKKALCNFCNVAYLCDRISSHALQHNGGNNAE